MVGKRKRAPRKRAPRKKNLAREVSKIEKHIKATELKQLSTYTAQQNMSNVGSTFHLDAIAQGSDYFNRQGDQVKPMKAVIRWYMQNTSNANYNQCRGWLVRVKNSSGTITPANLLDIPAGALRTEASLNTVYSHIAVGDKFVSSGAEYEVLFDTGLMVLAPLLAADTSHPNIVIFNKKIPLSKVKPIHYTGNGAATYEYNTLIWFTVGQQVGVGDVVEGGTVSLYYCDD